MTARREANRHRECPEAERGQGRGAGDRRGELLWAQGGGSEHQLAAPGRHRLLWPEVREKLRMPSGAFRDRLPGNPELGRVRHAHSRGIRVRPGHQPTCSTSRCIAAQRAGAQGIGGPAPRQGRPGGRAQVFVQQEVKQAAGRGEGVAVRGVCRLLALQEQGEDGTVRMDRAGLRERQSMVPRPRALPSHANEEGPVNTSHGYWDYSSRLASGL